MREYGFSLGHIFSYKMRINDFRYMGKYGQRKPVFLHDYAVRVLNTPLRTVRKIHFFWNLLAMIINNGSFIYLKVFVKYLVRIYSFRKPD